VCAGVSSVGCKGAHLRADTHPETVEAFTDTRLRLRAALAAVVVAAASAALLGLPAGAGATGQVTVLSFSKAPTSLAGLQAEARRVRVQMHRLGRQLAVVTGKYNAARARLERINEGLTQARLQLAGCRAELDREQTLAGERLAAMYKMGDYGLLDVLADCGGFSDPQTRLAFFRLISEQDRQTETRLAQLTSQVQGLEETIAGDRQEALSVQAEIDAQRALMSRRVAERRAILDRLIERIKTILASQGAAALAAPVHGGYTPFTWAQALLQRLGMPVTSSNLAALTAWEMAEGGHWHNSAHYNPLNTTQSEPGATSMNSVGVKAYVSWDQGFAATITTLHNGRYQAILAALRKGDDAQAVAAAVAASPWGTGAFAVR